MDLIEKDMETLFVLAGKYSCLWELEQQLFEITERNMIKDIALRTDGFC